MARFYDMAGWLLSSLGLALLVCGLVLVPQNRLLGDEPVEEIAGLQCPTRPEGGCENPGARCMFYDLPSTCGPAPNPMLCTCLDPR